MSDFNDFNNDGSEGWPLPKCQIRSAETCERCDSEECRERKVLSDFESYGGIDR